MEVNSQLTSPAVISELGLKIQAPSRHSSTLAAQRPT